MWSRPRQQAQPPPAAFGGEGDDVIYRRFPGDGEIECWEALSPRCQADRGTRAEGHDPPRAAAARFARLPGRAGRRHGAGNIML
jgi:hypothetical protein